MPLSSLSCSVFALRCSNPSRKGPPLAQSFEHVGMCSMWAGQRAWWSQDARMAMPWCMLHAALRAEPRGWTDIDFVRDFSAFPAHAKWRGGELRVILRQRESASALRMTLEPECVHMCRSSECTSVVSVISMYHVYGLHSLRVEMMTFVLAALIPFPR